MSNLVLRNQHFFIHTIRPDEHSIRSSICLDVSYISCSRYFAGCVEPTEDIRAKNRLILNWLWRGSVHIDHKGGQHEELKHRNSTAVHEIAVQLLPTPPTIHQGSDIGQTRGSTAFVEAFVGRYICHWYLGVLGWAAGGLFEQNKSHFGPTRTLLVHDHIKPCARKACFEQYISAC